MRNLRNKTGTFEIEQINGKFDGTQKELMK
jgi:hypothetical protein